MSTALPEATNVATLQGVESRCKRLVARFEAEREAFIPQLERFVKDEPTRLLTSCDDVTRLCRVSTPRIPQAYSIHLWSDSNSAVTRRA